MTRQSTGQEKIFASYMSDKGLASKIYKNSYNSTTENPIKKWAELNVSESTYRWPIGA